MNSTVIILKICGLIRKRLAKGAMVAGWQISDKVRPPPMITADCTSKEMGQ